MKLRRIDLNHEEFLAAVSGEMTPAELGVYWMICLLQYNRGGKSIRYDMEWLRRKFTASPGNQAIKGIVDHLIKTGRLIREGNELWSSRCRAESERRASLIRALRENGARGGRPRNDINGIEKAEGFSDQKDTSTSTNIEKKDSEADASGVAPPQTPPVDPVKLLWDSAVELLESAHVKNPRPLIGKWRREYGDVAVMAAVNQAASDTVSEPVGFIVATLAKTGANGHGRANGQRKLSAVDNLFLGAARAADAFARRERNRGSPVTPLLDC